MFWNEFHKAMADKFVGFDEFSRLMAVSMVTGRNLIAFGPGGHAKSEGVKYALRLVSDQAADTYVQSCGEGMTEERLYGGVDLKALEEEHVLQFNAEHSFLMARWVVFEEMLDMPDAAALSLRDTLTAKELRNGRQRETMRTESIFALTNREPREKAGLDPSYKALLERFPLQIRVGWSSYTGKDYLRLFEKVRNWTRVPELAAGALMPALEETRELFYRVTIDDECAETLANLLAKAGSKGSPISPRTAIYATEIVRASAAMRGSQEVTPEDFIDLVFLPDVSLVDDIRVELQRARAVVETERQVKLLSTEFEGLLAALVAASTPDETVEAIARLETFEMKLATLDMQNLVLERRVKREQKKQPEGRKQS
jgi:hypothetical protein